jgi:sialic acid synthase SpsE
MKIGERLIGPGEATFFIADLAANHDGDLSRALDLIGLAAEAGADAVKFQHFRADHIVSDRGFRELGNKKSHQAGWSKPVYQVYADASLPWEWTEQLADAAKNAGVFFMTSPYDLEAIEFVAPFVVAYKVGSGDVTWLEAIDHMASKGKPVFLATGASTLDEVRRAVNTIKPRDVPFAVMQCNTNYTAERENLQHTNLNVLRMYREEFPEGILGLSDHSHGDVTVLGAVALGARVIEKHFTDDTSREGPDHYFSMTPGSWRQMVERTRDLELALGSTVKVVAPNEADTVVLQRRALRFARAMKAGERLSRGDLIPLRPAPFGSVSPDLIESVLGRSLVRDVETHDTLSFGILSD